MFNKFFKIFFFTTLAVAALLTAFFLIFRNSYWLSNFSDGNVLSAFAALAPIILTVGCGILSLFLSFALKFICKKNDRSDKKKTNFFVYYSIALIIVSLLVLLFSVLRFNITEYTIWTGDTIAILLLFDACVAEATVLAALLVSVTTLWKTNRLVAIIIGIIIILIIPVNYISGESLRYLSSYDSSYANNDYSDYSSYDIASSYNDDEDGNEDEEVIEVEDDYLSFLWDEDDNISKAFAYLFQDNLSYWGSEYPQTFLSDIDIKIDHLNADSNDRKSWTWLSAGEKKSEETHRRIYSYLTEHPSEIIKAFYSYQSLIYQCMPIDTFYGTGAYALLEYLMVARNDLYSDGDLSRLKNIYKLMCNIEHSSPNEYYDDIKLHINESYLAAFYDKDGDFYQGGVVWAYSFWARRNAEGTDDIAYSILTTLQEYYSDAVYYQDSDYEEEDYDEDYYEEEQEH